MRIGLNTFFTKTLKKKTIRPQKSVARLVDSEYLFKRKVTKQKKSTTGTHKSFARLVDSENLSKKTTTTTTHTQKVLLD